MENVTLQELLEGGLYFGHPSKRFDPRMKPFIFGKRQGIYIIDLEKTKIYLEKACEFLKKSAQEGKRIMFVGTKRQARELVKEAAGQLGILYMANRWLGGTLTNFPTVKRRIDRLNELEVKEAAGVLEKLTKKEAATVRKEKGRLLKNLEGVRNMQRIPDILLVIDAKKEEIAIREARKLGLLVVAVVDTNSNPDLVDYPIPANDDGIKGLRVLVSKFKSAISAGQEDRSRLATPEVKVEVEVTREEEVKEPAVVQEVIAGPEPLGEEEPSPVVLEKEKKEEKGKGKKTPAKPKPRPRIRAKVRRSFKKTKP
ncbi:MAG: 30S ribosomal protein S2 [Candidatus Omnitrophota bacterium]